MGRGIEAGLEAALLEKGGRKSTGGTLAVGSRYMDYRKTQMGVTQLCQKGLGRLKTETPTQTFKGIEAFSQRYLVAEKFEKLTHRVLQLVAVDNGIHKAMLDQKF